MVHEYLPPRITVSFRSFIRQVIQIGFYWSSSRLSFRYVTFQFCNDLCFSFFFAFVFFGKIVIRASANVSRRHQRPTRFPFMLMYTRVTSSTPEAAHHSTSYALHSTLIGFCVTIWQEVDVSHKKEKNATILSISSLRLRVSDKWIIALCMFLSWAYGARMLLFSTWQVPWLVCIAKWLFDVQEHSLKHFTLELGDGGSSPSIFPSKSTKILLTKWLWMTVWSPLLPVLESTARSTWCHWSPIQREECNHLEWHASCCCPSDWPTRSSFIGGEPLLAQRACSGACDFGSCRVLLRTLFFWRCLDRAWCLQARVSAGCKSLWISTHWLQARGTPVTHRSFDALMPTSPSAVSFPAGVSARPPGTPVYL